MKPVVKNDISSYIVSTWLSGDGRGFDADTDLQQAGILDSFSTLALIGFLDSRFDVQLEPAEVNAATFRSVQSITDLIVEKLARNGSAASG